MGKMVSGRVAVVVVSYNSAAVLPGLLDSLVPAFGGREGFRVIVADNLSGDGSATVAERHPLAPEVIRTGRNAGYASAINLVSSRVDEGDALLVLNPDIRLAPGAARGMLDRLRDDVGIVAPRMVDEDGSLSYSIRREPSLRSTWCEAFLGGTVSARLGLGEVVRDPKAYAGGAPVEWTTGAALLVSPSVRRHVGPWDESYFLYSEEVDYMRRARQAGFRIAYAAEATAIHIGGESNVNPRLYALMTANRIRYYARYHNRMASALFRAGVVTNEAIRAVRGGGTHRAGLRAALAVPPPSSFVGAA